MHRVGRDDGAFQVQNLQQFLNGRYLIRFLRHADLAQAKVHVIRPHVHHMQRLHRSGAVVRTSPTLDLKQLAVI